MKATERIKALFQKNRAYRLFLCIALLLLILLNLLALSPGFCNFYADHIYPVIATTLGAVMSVFPIAIGEIQMYLAALAVLTLFILLILLPFLRKKKSFRHFTAGFARGMLLVLAGGLLIYTLNWLIPFRSPVLGGQGKPGRERYSVSELRALYYHIVDGMNAASAEVPRDADGNVIYPVREEMEERANDALRGISDEYSRLKGYYPPAKIALCSDVLRWMRIGGFTFPYTLEVFCNDYLSELYFPTLYAHEESHHKGYYRENEAEFLSYLALSESADPLLRYSAYTSFYDYVNTEYYSALKDTDADEEYFTEYEEHSVLPQVWKDLKAAREAVEARYKQNSHPLENLSKVASDIADTGWKTQSKILGDDSYDGVVLLMLKYYEGILY